MGLVPGRLEIGLDWRLECQGIGSDDVSNPVEEEDMAEDIGAQLQARKRNKKKKRSIGRLLKFHEKLCNLSGLPPSRLMEQQTPVCSSGGKKRRLV